MSELTLSQVVEKVQQLPSLSLVVNDILHSFDDEHADTDTLVAKIGHDQGLAARVLRVANSAFYGLSNHVSSVGEAVVVLGFHSVRSLALAAGIINQFPPGGGKQFDRLAFWRHAIGVGVCARVIAARRGENGETAFTAGLLHDVGKLVLDAHFHEEFEAVLGYREEHDCELIDAEQAVLNLTHAAIGFEVAQRWKFPATIQWAIRDHHRPPDTGEAAPLSDLVHFANVLCHALEIGNACYDLVPPLSIGAWQRLGLNWEEMPALLREIARVNTSTNLLLGE